jgi:hypothetical protein
MAMPIWAESGAWRKNFNKLQVLLCFGLSQPGVEKHRKNVSYKIEKDKDKRKNQSGRLDNREISFSDRINE